MSSSASQPAPGEAAVFFKEDGPMRTYVLNRQDKLNALDEPMLNILRPKVEEWSKSDLAKVVVGTGVGRAFCAGGDVASVVNYASNVDTLPKAIDFFHREFEMDYILAVMPKPYVAVMDGITMGGGVGLAVNAPFRIATEKTRFAMPETKIGYCPDVGASYFLPQVDGEIGTYLGLTGNEIRGKAVFEHGFATHYVPSSRISALLERIASLETPTYGQIDSLIEEHRANPSPEDNHSILVGDIRRALDACFRHDSVEQIVADLKTQATNGPSEAVRKWAKDTSDAIHLRSPTSLKVALAALRKGKKMTLLEALQMEMNIATAFCHGVTPDFATGVTHVLVEKSRDPKPQWSPATLEEVKDEFVEKQFFGTYSPEANGQTAPKLAPPEWLANHAKPTLPMKYALPTENEIGQMVLGAHKASGGTALTLEELLAQFDDMRRGKMGVKEKVREVVARRCQTEEDAQTGQKWLKWVRNQ
ncbi:3-hydroxyisobutyryl-coenzyme A hydrolase [Laetiporus sulphureus 93-53]|uniref:3-hydroxyisobutyryl-CoA hydrolase n=1 Tax=Laetiporus sulphureus 93-53 TaxID=1314785 RepID=A0A165C6X4_9APHY|nr:3-hydroxyisobutyryl-coenzyme A hydrolase [Laetiporus sulphureus 93-53]KZT02305.1 3-hydroxyisobutyryl-coenzyme A hydrolase [Laetiporus sulphureus 93-53]